MWGSASGILSCRTGCIDVASGICGAVDGGNIPLCVKYGELFIGNTAVDAPIHYVDELCHTLGV